MKTNYMISQRSDGWYVMRTDADDEASALGRIFTASHLIDENGVLRWKPYVYNDKPYCTYFSSLQDLIQALGKMDG